MFSTSHINKVATGLLSAGAAYLLGKVWYSVVKDKQGNNNYNTKTIQRGVCTIATPVLVGTGYAISKLLESQREKCLVASFCGIVGGTTLCVIESNKEKDIDIDNIDNKQNILVILCVLSLGINGLLLAKMNNILSVVME